MVARHVQMTLKKNLHILQQFFFNINLQLV
jgi:hypothetical protein